LPRPTPGCVSFTPVFCIMTRPWPRAGVLALTLILATACASSGRPPGLKPAHVERLYFGRNIGDTAMVSDSAWNHFVHTVLTPTFPEGATVWDAAGQWRAPNGELVRERSFVVELVHLVTPDVEARVQRVMADYKRIFAQQAVLRLVTNAWAGF
jgi:hypothetical protein